MSTGNRFGTESFCTRSTAWRGLEPLETRLFLSVSPAEEFADPVRVVDGKLQTVEVSFDGYQGEAVGGSWIVTFEQNEQNSRLYKADDGTDFRSFNPAGPATKADDMEAALRLIGREFRFDSYLGNLGSAEILAPVDADPKEVVARLMKLPGVISVTPNWIYGNSMGIPNDLSFTSPTFPRQWPLLNPSNPSNDIDAVTAWDKATGSDAVVVGVIDSGIMLNHEDLTGNLWLNPTDPVNGIDDDGNNLVDDTRGWNFVNNNSNMSDVQIHGTHVSGILGAVGNNEIGIAGVSWDVTILTLRASDANGQFPTSAIVNSINYATAKKQAGINLRVLNASFGGYIGDNTVRDAIRLAGEAGILLEAVS